MTRLIFHSGFTIIMAIRSAFLILRFIQEECYFSLKIKSISHMILIYVSLNELFHKRSSM